MEYKGVDYPVRETHHKGYGGDVLIGSHSLQDAIWKEDEGYVDEKARYIDEQIYAYADDEVLLNLTDEEFENYINENID